MRARPPTGRCPRWLLSAIATISYGLSPQLAWAQPTPATDVDAVTEANAAETPAPAETAAQAAARHFEAALAHADRKEFALAVLDFERAHQLSPHHSVSYNLGLSHVALGQSSSAIAAFERCLLEAGTELGPERRARITELIELEQQKLGRLELSVTPESALVSIDGAAPVPANGEIVLDAGKHELVLRAPGHLPRATVVAITSAQATPLQIALLEEGPRSRAFQVACPIPDVRISVDGALLAQTAGGPSKVSARVASSARVLELSRPGYAPQRIDLAGVSDAATLPCSLSPSSSPLRGSLELRVDQAGTRQTLDGVPFTGQALVPGRHWLVVEHPSFSTWSRLIDVQATGTTLLWIDLAGASRDSATEDAGDGRRTWSYVAAGGALACGAAALGVLVHANNRYSAWERNRTAIEVMPENQDRRDAVASNAALQGDITALDNVSLGLGLGAGALLAGAGYLYFSASADAGKPVIGVSGSTLIVTGEF